MISSLSHTPPCSRYSHSRLRTGNRCQKCCQEVGVRVAAAVVVVGVVVLVVLAVMDVVDGSGVGAG